MKSKVILRNLWYTQDFRGQGATIPAPSRKLQKLLLLTSGISQPVPPYNGELWALHSGPIPIPIPIILHLNILNLWKIPTLKTKKIPGPVPANYSTIMGKIPNCLQTRCLNYVLTTRYLKLQNQQGNHRELVLHRSKWVSAGKRRVSQYIHCFRVV